MYCEPAKLDYDLSTFLGFEYPEPSTCIKHQVREDKDLHEEMGGFPKTYKWENTIIRQKWWTEEEHDFEAIGNSLGMEVVTLSSILQPPGSTVPWHHDQFFLLKKKFPDRPQPVRALMMLEDWKLGHFLQFGDDVFHHWKAGDGYIIDDEVRHLGTNAGMQDKYTLQVSGFLK
jgi:hypothetical protein